MASHWQGQGAELGGRGGGKLPEAKSEEHREEFLPLSATFLNKRKGKYKIRLTKITHVHFENVKKVQCFVLSCFLTIQIGPLLTYWF